MNDRGFARAQWAYDNATPPEPTPCCRDAEDGEECGCRFEEEYYAEMQAEERADWAREDIEREEW